MSLGRCIYAYVRQVENIDCGLREGEKRACLFHVSMLDSPLSVLWTFGSKARITLGTLKGAPVCWVPFYLWWRTINFSCRTFRFGAPYQVTLLGKFTAAVL